MTKAEAKSFCFASLWEGD